MAQWAEIPLEGPLFQNIDEAIITTAHAAMENCYTNQAKGQSRFPGMVKVVDLPGAKTYVASYRNDLYAVTNEGRIYRINKLYQAEDVTQVPLSGGRRPTFAATEDQLLIAAGGPIISVNNNGSLLLSLQAPDTTHVGFIAGYVVAIEPYSGRFYHSEVGNYTVWNAIDLFTAETKPDDLIALIVTPFNELLLAGTDSIEQFEPAPSGTRAFTRRWSTGEGLLAPYSFYATKEGTWGINPEYEFVKFALQSSTPESDDVTLAFQKVDDWEDAWTSQLLIKGQKLMLLRIPNASNPYGTKGLTFIYDYRGRRWSNLYGWDADLGVPIDWPGQSHVSIWGKNFVGVPGGIAELRDDLNDNLSFIQRMLFRTGHIDRFGPCRFDRMRLRLKRGTDAYQGKELRFGLRINKDNRGFGRMMWKTIGRPGHSEMVLEYPGLGMARTWQFEFQCTDPAEIEMVSMEVLVERMGW